MHLQQHILPDLTGRGRAFGTFGELLQGVDMDDQDFLVTLPTNRFSTAIFTSASHQRKLTVFPSRKQKAGQLASLILEYYGLPMGGILELESNIPVGKGLASSSADLVATARAIDHCFGLGMLDEQLQLFLRQIEPTDGVMYEGAVSFYHRKVELCEYLGPLPKLTVVGIDEGGEVDTIEFNKLPKPFTPEEKQEYGRLLQKISAAIRCGNLQIIGEVATCSAILNQKLSAKQYFEQVLDICKVIRGLGVVVAHSGTYLGILLSSEDPHYYKQLHSAYEALLQLVDEVALFHSWCINEKDEYLFGRNSIFNNLYI